MNQEIDQVLRISFPRAADVDSRSLRNSFTSVPMDAAARFPPIEQSLEGVQVVVSGVVALYMDCPVPGNRRCLRILGKGDATVACNGTADWGLSGPGLLVALTDALVLHGPPDALRTLCSTVPAFGLDAAAVLAGNLALARMRLTRAHGGTAVSNLAMELVLLDRRFGDGDRSTPAACRGVLADLLGVSRETLYRAIRQLRAEGLVSSGRGPLTILDRSGLARRAGLDRAAFGFAERALLADQD